MKRRIELPRVEGRVSRQAHADLPDATYERELGKEGFFGPASHMYHTHPPTGWDRFEGPLRPRAFDTAKLAGETESPWQATPLLHNASVRVRLWRTSGRMARLARNADGDDLLFVHAGSGRLFCDFGHLPFQDGDYLLLPRGTMWRIEADTPVTILAIQASGGAYGLPDRGMLGEHAVFDPGVLETPRLDDVFDAQRSERPTSVEVLARGTVSTIHYPFNPLDAVGWKGMLAPLRLNWRDIRPVTSARYHLPPSVHTTFLGPRFVVCTFCPRPLESDPGALKVPFFHSNDDFDEVIFYHSGDFMSRDDVRPGMVTLHPFGFPHGPHPGALERSQSRPRAETNEVAVMIDARDSLDVSTEVQGVELEGYVDSWKPRADGS